MGRALALIGFALAAACTSGPYLEGQVTVVGGGAGPCTTRGGEPIPDVRISTRTAGDSRDTRDVACGGRFSLEAGPGVYYLHAWVYTPDGATQLGNGELGPFELTDGQPDVDVGTLTVQLF